MCWNIICIELLWPWAALLKKKMLTVGEFTSTKPEWLKMFFFFFLSLQVFIVQSDLLFVDQRENIRVIYRWLKGENIRLTDAHSKGAFYTVPFWINVLSVSGKKVVNTYAPVYNFDADCVMVPKLCQRLRLFRSIFAFTIHLRNFQHISWWRVQ